MGYRICYEYHGGNNRKIRRIMTAVFFLLFLLFVNFCWPEGKAQLMNTLSFFRGCAAVSALDRMAAEMLNGELAAEVFSGFLDRLLP